MSNRQLFSFFFLSFFNIPIFYDNKRASVRAEMSNFFSRKNGISAIDLLSQKFTWKQKIRGIQELTENDRYKVYNECLRN